MKLNFWQWIGLILLVVGVILLMRRTVNNDTPQPAPTTTQPMR